MNEDRVFYKFSDFSHSSSTGVSHDSDLMIISDEAFSSHKDYYTFTKKTVTNKNYNALSDLITPVDTDLFLYDISSNTRYLTNNTE